MVKANTFPLASVHLKKKNGLQVKLDNKSIFCPTEDSGSFLLSFPILFSRSYYGHATHERMPQQKLKNNLLRGALAREIRNIYTAMENKGKK